MYFIDNYSMSVSPRLRPWVHRTCFAELLVEPNLYFQGEKMLKHSIGSINWTIFLCLK